MKLVHRFALLAAFSLTSCSSKPHQAADVVGIYVGNYGGGTETFDLRSDGEFTQIATVGERTMWQNEGSWSFNADENEVTFRHFLRCSIEPFDLTKKPDLMTNDRCDWSDAPGQLLFYVDINYLAVRRSKDQGAASR